VGPREALQARTVTGDDFSAAVDGLPTHWKAGDRLPGCPDGGSVLLGIRHRHAGAPVREWVRQDDRIRVELAEPVDGPAPGQGLVLYAGDLVLGGGRITAQGRAGGKGTLRP